MEFTKVPLSCLKPQKIVHPYTNEEMYVPCGKCKCCLNNKGLRSTQLIKLESKMWKYNLFITLTFDELSIPRMHEIKCTDDVYEFYDDEGTFLFQINNFNDYKFYKLQSKVNNYSLPYLSKPHLQKFMKRFRDYILRYYNEKEISYFAIGEYGPLHLRPHFHIILHTNNSDVAKNIKEILHKSWSYGRIDYSRARDKCASYVAQYVNSTVSLPSIYKDKSVRPFCCHSRHYGIKFFESSPKEILENDIERTFNRVVEIDGRYTNVQVPYTLAYSNIPRCKAMFYRDDVLCLKSYTNYERCRRYYKEENCGKLSANIVEDIVRAVHQQQDIYGCVHFELFNPRIQYILDDIEYNNDTVELVSMITTPYVDTCKKSLYSMVYNIIRSGYLFERLYQHYPNITKYDLVLKIKDFYKRLDYYTFKKCLKFQEEYFEEHDISDLDFFYNNNFDIIDYENTESYQQYYKEQTYLYENKMKHKYLNDKNKIFIYE